MQFDATLNVTLEIEDDEWKAFLEMNYGDEDGHYDEDEAIFDGAVDSFVEDVLGGEDIPLYYGRAWVCSVDDASIL